MLALKYGYSTRADLQAGAWRRAALLQRTTRTYPDNGYSIMAPNLFARATPTCEVCLKLLLRRRPRVFGARVEASLVTPQPF